MTEADADLQGLSEVVDRARERADETLVVSVGDVQVELTAELREILLALLEKLAAGKSVDIAVMPDVLTTGQAADLLGVSRPTVVKLVDNGDLPATRVGSRRRLAATDVLAYRARSQTGRAATVDDIISVSEELDLY
ncbi:MAG TPA: helix-turn-helix domain-containing protein [Acidimicrobiales bacterium]|nr:helix-turn-helix domain-containing protein [Acidimicrobiales bacterium]